MQYVTSKIPYPVDIEKSLFAILKKRGLASGSAAHISIQKIQEQRNLIERIKAYKTESDISDYKCYLSYLFQLEEVLPILAKECDIKFIWADCFSLKKVTSKSILFEKASVMFNIAALYTQKAFAIYTLGDLTIEKVAQAIDALSNAALYFVDIANQYSNALVSLGVSEDLSAPIVKILSDLCIAQGQYLYFMKARLSNFPARGLYSLLKVASDMYYGIRDQMQAYPRYFPSGLIKHFEVGYKLVNE